MPAPPTSPTPMTRLDVFVDAAFAFAITMLVISIDEVPSTYTELVEALKGGPAFLVSFAGIMGFWIGQKSWSQRFGDERDPVSLLLVLTLVFLVMVFVYPLKVISAAFFDWASGGWLQANFRLEDPLELLGIFQIYGIGFFALATTQALLYLRSLQRSAVLGLTVLDRADARVGAGMWIVMAVTGAASALWAALLPPRIAVWAGFVYTSLFATTFAVSYWLSPKQEEKEAMRGE